MKSNCLSTPQPSEAPNWYCSPVLPCVLLPLPLFWWKWKRMGEECCKKSAPHFPRSATITHYLLPHTQRCPLALTGLCKGECCKCVSFGSQLKFPLNETSLFIRCKMCCTPLDMCRKPARVYPAFVALLNAEVVCMHSFNAHRALGYQWFY